MKTSEFNRLRSYLHKVPIGTGNYCSAYPYTRGKVLLKCTYDVTKFMLAFSGLSGKHFPEIKYIGRYRRKSWDTRDYERYYFVSKRYRRPNKEGIELSYNFNLAQDMLADIEDRDTTDNDRARWTINFFEQEGVRPSILEALDKIRLKANSFALKNKMHWTFDLSQYNIASDRNRNVILLDPVHFYRRG